MPASFRFVGRLFPHLFFLPVLILSNGVTHAQTGGVGLAWTRANPMYVSSLVISIANPPTDWMDAYFDDFNASALLLWRGSVSGELDDWLARDPATPYVAWVEVDGTISRRSDVIATCLANPGCIGFQVGDEPDGPLELRAIAAGIDAIHALDPNALAIVNVLGSEPLFRHNRAAGLADVLSTTNYYGDDAQSWRVRARAREAALAHGIPYWTYLDSSGDPRDLAWRAMSGLAVGYTGFSWFLYQLPPGDNHQLARDYVGFFEEVGAFDSPTTDNFAAAAEVNEWLSVLGRAFTQLTNTEVLYASSEYSRSLFFAEWQPSLIPLLTGLDRIDGGDWLISTFSDDDDNKYFSVLNARHPTGDTDATTGFGSDRVTLEFDLPPGTTVRILNQDDGSIIERTLDEYSSITFDIPAGQLLLFTFAGHPFAGVEIDLDCATNPAVCLNPASVMVDTATIVAGFLRVRASRLAETGPDADYLRSRLSEAGGQELPQSVDAAIVSRDGNTAVWANASFERYTRGSYWMPVDGIVTTYQTGIDFRASDRFVVGAMLGVDMAREMSPVFGHEIGATGWMAGPYAGFRIGNVMIDAMLLGGRATGDVLPIAGQSDAFVSHRWLATARVSTEFDIGRLRILPELSFARFNETQLEYVDANGITIPEQEMTHRQVAFGGEASLQLQTERGLVIEPSIAARGVFDLVWNDLSVELQGGMRLRRPNGTSLSLDVAYGGLFQPGQSDFRISGSLSIPLR